jgi:hypothetical protein
VYGIASAGNRVSNAQIVNSGPMMIIRMTNAMIPMIDKMVFIDIP